LTFKPCIPADWTSYKMTYNYLDTVYLITVSQFASDRVEQTVQVDGIAQPDCVIHLINDATEHTVEIKLMTLS